MKKLFKKWFTLIEIMVATFIGTIILAFIFVFLWDIVDGISKAKNEVRSIWAYHDFSTKIINYRNIYNTWSIAVDNGSWSWSDILMLTNLDKTKWVLVWAIDMDNFKLATTNLYYKNLSLWFRQLNAQDISNITSTWSLAYDYLFFKDKVFPDLIVKDIQLDIYNSGSLFDMNMIINLNYNNWLNWLLWKDLPEDDLLKVNLNF